MKQVSTSILYCSDLKPLQELSKGIVDVVHFIQGDAWDFLLPFPYSSYTCAHVLK